MTDLGWFLMVCTPLSILAGLVTVGATEWSVRKARRAEWDREYESVMGSALGMSAEEYRVWMDSEDTQ